jgi:cation diffusion facilitator family transporter
MTNKGREIQDSGARPFVYVMLAINVGLVVASLLVYLSSRSQLVLAQGFDSLVDIAAGIILAISVWVGSQPHDENHPYGHNRAEPIGALVTAVLAGVLAFEVLRSAVDSLIAGDVADMDIWVAAILGGKFILKGLLLTALVRRKQRTQSSAIDALRVDARNDLFACGTSLLGFGLASYGFHWADGVLAIPVAFYIGVNGFQLARENLRYLMGEAPSEEILQGLRGMTSKVEGVIDVGRLRAQYIGPQLHVEVEILINEFKSATQGHDIALRVQQVLEANDNVNQAFVHIDTVDTVDHA